MLHRVVLAVQALDDIDAVGAYVGFDSLRVEQAFFEGMRRALAHLERFPHAGRERDTRRRVFPGLRSWPVPGFPNVLVFYRVVGDEVEVARVLHGARDLGDILEGDPSP